MTANIDALIDMVTRQSEGVRVKSRAWSTEEDNFLRIKLGYLTEAEMGKSLGRTEIAVRLRWKRDLKLKSPSKAPDVLTAHQAAKLLGIDGHKIAHWVDKGLIPGRLMAGGRKIRLITRKDFEAWCLDHDNWIYFNSDNITDPDLKRKVKAAARKWRDAWWTTPQVARHHNVSTQDVKRLIQDGRIRARQITVSYGGRHPQLRWRLWFVLKSEATRKSLKFVRRKHAN